VIRRVLVLAACALVVGGCGNKQKETRFSDTEGTYLDMGGLKYQVQISRQLNPNDVEDHSYLTGVPRTLASLSPGESWFGVFLRVENGGDKYLPAAGSFVLKDTQDNSFLQVPISRENPFSYHGGFVAPKNTLPPSGSLAQQNESIDGALILFKVPNASYANRPLELTIRNPRNQRDTVSVDLDV
jgi:hypothetical protein